MSDIARTLGDFTGKHTRIVWLQQQTGVNGAKGLDAVYRLMGVDSNDERGVRAICDTTASYANPAITPGGDRVIFTDCVEKTVCVVDWDGSNRRVVCEGGYCSSPWMDPRTGVEYALVRPNREKSWVSKSSPMEKIAIDDPSQREVLWSKTNTSSNGFWLSPDGACAAAVAPWPQCGTITVPEGEFRHFHKGCWCSIAQDNSHRSMFFFTHHREVHLYDAEGNQLSRIDVATAPELKGWEVYHPRWAKDPRFITVTGPYSQESDEENRQEEYVNLIKYGGRNVELFIGRFNNDMTEVADWLQITHNDKPDYWGHAWMAGEG